MIFKLILIKILVRIVWGICVVNGLRFNIIVRRISVCIIFEMLYLLLLWIFIIVCIVVFVFVILLIRLVNVLLIFWLISFLLLLWWVCVMLLVIRDVSRLLMVFSIVRINVVLRISSVLFWLNIGRWRLGKFVGILLRIGIDSVKFISVLIISVVSVLGIYLFSCGGYL